MRSIPTRRYTTNNQYTSSQLASSDVDCSTVAWLPEGESSAICDQSTTFQNVPLLTCCCVSTEPSKLVPRNLAWAGGNTGSASSQLAELFPLDACVRASVKTVSPGALALSLKPSAIHTTARPTSSSLPTSSSSSQPIALGRITEKELHALLSAAPQPEHAPTAPPPPPPPPLPPLYLAVLARNPIFSSPDCTRAMASAYSVRQVGCLG